MQEPHGTECTRSRGERRSPRRLPRQRPTPREGGKSKRPQKQREGRRSKHWKVDGVVHAVGKETAVGQVRFQCSSWPSSGGTKYSSYHHRGIPAEEICTGSWKVTPFKAFVGRRVTSQR